MRVFMFVAFAALMVSACAPKGTMELKDKSAFELKKRNIIERDLTVPYVRSVSVPPTETNQAGG